LCQKEEILVVGLTPGKFVVLMLRISLNIVCPFDESTGRKFEEGNFWKSGKHSTKNRNEYVIFIPLRKWDYLMATYVNENNGKTISIERSPKWLQFDDEPTRSQNNKRDSRNVKERSGYYAVGEKYFDLNLSIGQLTKKKRLIYLYCSCIVNISSINTLGHGKWDVFSQFC